MTPEPEHRPRMVIHGPKGFVRSILVYPGPRGAVLRVEHTREPSWALRLCTATAAHAMKTSIEAHYPLIDTGYTVTTADEADD